MEINNDNLNHDVTKSFVRDVAGEEMGRYDETLPVDVGGERLSQSRFSLSNRIDTSGNFGQQFVEATRSLLRERLNYAAITLAGLILIVLALSLLFDQPTIRLTVLRIVSLALTLGVIGLLKWMPDSNLKQLRMFEVLLFAIPIVEACTALLLGTSTLVADNKFEEIRELHFLIGTAVAVFIAVYGVFIPATWRRTAVMTLLAALIPGTVAWVQARWEPSLAQAGIPNLAMSALLVMMATVSTLGARLFNVTRKEAVSARRYGQYHLTEEIGRGGMGVVYRAEHRMLKRPAAIKLIRYEAAFDERAIEQFQNEVQLSATLSHWNTVQIFDYGLTGSGDFYYVMEYLDGESLRDRLLHHGPLSVEEVISLVSQICDGLSEAHQRGMVHRDLKPGNIFLANIGGRKDTVKILDFGLAVETTDRKSGSEVCGSPPYMSPEQILGGAISPQSDIYSIGCVLFECLTAKQLFAGPSVSDILRDHTRGLDEIPRLPDDRKMFETVIQKCISQAADQRYESLDQLVQSVERLRS